MSAMPGRHRLECVTPVEPVKHRRLPRDLPALFPAVPEPAGAPRMVADLTFEAPNVGDAQRRVEAAELPSTGLWNLSNVALDAGTLGPFWVSAASVAGRRHGWSGQTRQDSYAVELSRDGAAVVLVVADGLGSRPLSQLGARHLTRSIAGAVAAADLTGLAETGEEVLLAGIERAQQELADVWGPAYGIKDSRVLACTIAVVVLPTARSAGPVLVARVGDATVLSATNATDEPFTGIFATGEGPVNVVSASIPSAAVRQEVEIRRLDPAGVGKLVLCTDGLADDVYESPGIRSWLARRWAHPCTERWMLETLSYARVGSQDDRTAVVVWLDPGAEPVTSADAEEAGTDED
jgi:serine/threonine protein phosphatase PrpC